MNVLTDSYTHEFSPQKVNMHTFAKNFSFRLLKSFHSSLLQVRDQCARSGQCQDTPRYSAALES